MIDFCSTNRHNTIPYKYLRNRLGARPKSLFRLIHCLLTLKHSIYLVVFMIFRMYVAMHIYTLYAYLSTEGTCMHRYLGGTEGTLCNTCTRISWFFYFLKFRPMTTPTAAHTTNVVSIQQASPVLPPVLPPPSPLQTAASFCLS